MYGDPRNIAIDFIGKRINIRNLQNAFLQGIGNPLLTDAGILQRQKGQVGMQLFDLIDSRMQYLDDIGIIHQGQRKLTIDHQMQIGHFMIQTSTQAAV